MLSSRKYSRWLWVACLACLACLAALPAVTAVTAASAVSAREPNLRLASTSAPTLAPGQSAWIAASWTVDCDASAVSTTVKAPSAVGVTYPTTRGGSDTSLYSSDSLVAATKDFTAFRLALPYSVTAGFQITLTTTYMADCSADNNRGHDKKKYTSSQTLTVPVKATDAEGIVPVNETMEIKAGSSAFEKLAITAGPGDISNVKVTLGDLPAGASVTYPNEGKFTMLNGDASLIGGTTDYVSFRFDATSVDAGSYTVPVTVSYTAAADSTSTGKVVINVAK